ncbi:MAG: FkbM family methyltransferase [Pirellula sp.]|nr:FkbM family methyltransferase [Pirellula sp.]
MFRKRALIRSTLFKAFSRTRSNTLKEERVLMLRTIKNFLRRRKLTSRGIRPEISPPTWTAGARSGMWTACTTGLSPASVVYSFGVGDNLAWECALIQRFGLQVLAFDPTPASVAWMAKQSLPPQLQFHAVGLAGHDGTLRFTLPSRGSRFNFRPQEANSSVESAAESTSEIVEAPVNRLATLQARFGHPEIDILKIDIEGGEYVALDDFLAAGVAPKQLLIEFHHHFPGVGLPATERAVAALRARGYRIFHLSDRGLEFSFLRT